MKTPRGSPQTTNKSLSLNSIDFPKGDDSCGKVQECHVGQGALLEPHEQLAEPVHPRVRRLHHPPVCLFPALLGLPLLAPGTHVGNVAALGDDPERLGAGVPGVRAEVLLYASRGTDDATVQDRRQLGHVMTVRPGDGYRQRDPTPVHEDVPLRPPFFPGR